MTANTRRKGGIVRQTLSYGGVSAMQTFVEFGVFAILQLIGLPFRLASTAAVFCSGTFTYVMHRHVTFKSSSNYARSIAMFVAMRLAPMDDVLSTATHFVLRTYKKHGLTYITDQKDERGAGN